MGRERGREERGKGGRGRGKGEGRGGEVHLTHFAWVTLAALVAPRTVRATIGDRAFPAAAASVWNSLPETVRSSPSLPVFRSRLKTELFARSLQLL